MILNFFKRLFGLFKKDSKSKPNPNNYSFRNQPVPDVAKELESGETLYYEDGSSVGSVTNAPKKKAPRKSTKPKSTKPKSIKPKS